MPITLSELEIILITALPSLTSIISMINMVSTFHKSFSQLKENEAIKAERDALVEQNKILMAECRKMRKQTALLIEKVSRVKYEDLTEVQNDKELQG